MEFDDNNATAFLSGPEEAATGLVSPISQSELTAENLYAKFNADHAEFQESRMQDNQDVERRVRASNVDRALDLKKQKMVIDAMLTQVLEHQLSLPAAANNN
jgi:hypothetical protein